MFDLSSETMQNEHKSPGIFFGLCFNKGFELINSFHVLLSSSSVSCKKADLGSGVNGEWMDCMGWWKSKKFEVKVESYNCSGQMSTLT